MTVHRSNYSIQAKNFFRILVLKISLYFLSYGYSLQNMTFCSITPTFESCTQLRFIKIVYNSD